MDNSSEPSKEPISVSFDGTRTTFRGPPGLKVLIQTLVAKCAKHEIELTMTNIIVRGMRRYVRYALQAKDLGELKRRLSDTFEDLDDLPDEDTVEETTEDTRREI